MPTFRPPACGSGRARRAPQVPTPGVSSRPSRRRPPSPSRTEARAGAAVPPPSHRTTREGRPRRRTPGRAVAPAVGEEPRASRDDRPPHVAAQTPDHVGRARRTMSSRRARAAAWTRRRCATPRPSTPSTNKPDPRAPLPYDVRNGVRLLCTAIEGPDGGDDLRDALARACASASSTPFPPAGSSIATRRGHFPRCFTPGTRPIRGPRETRVRPRVRGEGGDAARGWERRRYRWRLTGWSSLVGRAPRAVAAPGGGIARRRAEGEGAGSGGGAPQRQATHVMHVSLCRVLRATRSATGRDGRRCWYGYGRSPQRWPG